MRVRERQRAAPIRASMNEAFDKCFASYDEACKYPVLSDAWNTNKAAGDYWLGEGQKLLKIVYPEP